MARRIRAREVLRLSSVNGLSQNAIARTAHVSKHSVQDVLEAARERGVSWEDVEGMSEEAAYALLFPGRGDAGPVHADPDWARVHRELARTGVTLKLLHAEYACFLSIRSDQKYHQELNIPMICFCTSRSRDMASLRT